MCYMWNAAFMGVLQAAEGLGALVGAVLIASAVRINYHGRVFVWGSMLALVGLCVFSLSHWYMLSLPTLLFLGLGTAGFGTMQSTLVMLAGEIDLVVEGRDPASTDAVKWLDEASRRIAAQSGGDLKAVESLPIFLAGFNQGTLPDASRTTLIFDRIPSYFTGAVYDKQRGLALSIFGLTRVTSVERDRTLVSSLRSAGEPPAGLRAFPAGLAVVADAALSELRGDQLKLTLLAIALILLVLLVGYRRMKPAILAVLPTVVAAGAATGLLFVVGSVLNQRSSPITILLGGVVVAFATEFGVLWLARYRSERGNGIDPADAARVASLRVGPAIAASALALAAGFAVLALSSVPTVRDFGIWSAFDLLLATAAVLVLLPPLARRWYA